MNKLQNFVICHSQDLIILHDKKFKDNLIDFTWLLVGIDKDTDKLENYMYIKCQDLLFNIEDRYELLHMTAYYAIRDNNLIDYDTTNLGIYEYDVSFKAEFKPKLNTYLGLKGIDIICTKEIKFDVHFYNPLWLSELNRNAILSKYNREIKDIIKFSKYN